MPRSTKSIAQRIADHESKAEYARAGVSRSLICMIEQGRRRCPSSVERYYRKLKPEA